MSMKEKNLQVRKLLIAVATFASYFMTCPMSAYAGFYEDIMGSVAGKGVMDILSGSTKISIAIFIAGAIFIMATSGAKWLMADDNEKPAAKKNLIGKIIILIVVSCIPTVIPIIFKIFNFSADMVKTTV